MGSKKCIRNSEETFYHVGIVILIIISSLFPFIVVKNYSPSAAVGQSILPNPHSFNNNELQRPNHTGILVTDMSVLPELYKNVEKSVVHIYVENISYVNGSPNFRQTGEGSGFIYDREGHIVTNYHVISGTNIAFVTFSDGNSYSANVIGKDPYSDLAVLQVKGSSSALENLNPLPLANSSNVEVGQQVVAIGNPLGEAGSMSYGIIGQLNRPIPEPGVAFDIPGFIQIDVRINAGNSGGPLFDLSGHVIGMTTLGSFNPTERGTGLNYALPSNSIQRELPELILHGTYKHPWVGVNGVEIDPLVAANLGLNLTKGVIVLNVTRGSPAAAAGISQGDIITGIDYKQVKTLEDVIGYVDSTKSVGNTVVLNLIRHEKTLNIPIKLSQRPSPFYTKLTAS